MTTTHPTPTRTPEPSIRLTVSQIEAMSCLTPAQVGEVVLMMAQRAKGETPAAASAPVVQVCYNLVEHELAQRERRLERQRLAARRRRERAQQTVAPSSEASAQSTIQSAPQPATTSPTSAVVPSAPATATTAPANAKSKGTRFCPPSVSEVQAYIDEHHLSIDAQQFIDYYESRGWRMSNNVGMKDWRATLRNWVRYRREHPSSTSGDHHTSRCSLLEVDNQPADYLNSRFVTGAVAS